MLRSTLIWLGVLGIVSTSWSVSAAIFDRQGRRLSESPAKYQSIDWQMLPATAAYSGVGLVKIRQSTSCTGFLINTKATAPAYVLTNAHCLDMLNNLPGANEIIVNRTIQNRGKAGVALTFTPNYFAQSAPRRYSYEVKKVLYATMKNNDVALLELSPTQKELIAAGIMPLNISPTPSTLGEKIEVIGIPGDRVSVDRQFLHRSSCTLGPTVKVQEGVYTWSQSLRHRCSIVGGMSGSPMVAKGKVVGIVNTAGAEVVARSKKCLLNKPCELGSDKKIMVTGNENYGQLLTKMASCFTNQGIFQLSQPSCRLEKSPRF
jgi:V8-like Glu-specific endopeptidase